MISIILIALKACTAGYAFVLFRDLFKKTKKFEKETSLPVMSGISLVAEFFDTLGIGSFALTVAMAKATKQIKDKIIPGTLNVGYTIPTLFEAIIFTDIVTVDVITLVAMILSAVIGAWIGASFVAKMSEMKIRLVMGTALFVTAVIMTLGQLKLMPVGGDAIALTGLLLIVGCLANFILGALMTAGIGLYAPCMALVSILGMNPKVAFPIMMCSCAFLMPVASIKFIKEDAYDKKAALAMAVIGPIGVLIAAYLVKSLPLELMRWLVVAVVLITAVTMIRRALVVRNGRAQA